MKSKNHQKTIKLLFATLLLTTSFMSLMNIKKTLASSISGDQTSSSSEFSPNLYNNCYKSTPESHTVIGFIAMGMLGSGYLLKQRMKNQSSHVNNDIPVETNDYPDDLLSQNQEIQIIPFIEVDEIEEENHHPTVSNLEIQLVENQS